MEAALKAAGVKAKPELVDEDSVFRTSMYDHLQTKLTTTGSDVFSTRAGLLQMQSLRSSLLEPVSKRIKLSPAADGNEACDIELDADEHEAKDQVLFEIIYNKLGKKKTRCCCSRGWRYIKGVRHSGVCIQQRRGARWRRWRQVYRNWRSGFIC